MSLLRRNSIPPTTTLVNLVTKINVAERKLYVNCGFWGGVIPGNERNLPEMVRHGVVGFKCFLCPSGVDEFPNVTFSDLEIAAQRLQGLDTVLAVRIKAYIAGKYKREIYALRWLYNNLINGRHFHVLCIVSC